MKEKMHKTMIGMDTTKMCSSDVGSDAVSEKRTKINIDDSILNRSLIDG